MDPSTVTAEMMAPSKVTSKDSHLPVIPLTPVHVMAKMLKEVTGILMNDDLASDGEALESDVEIEDEDDQNPFMDEMKQPPMQLALILEDDDEGEGKGDHVSINPEEVEDESAAEAESVLAMQSQLNMAEECIRKAVK